MARYRSTELNTTFLAHVYLNDMEVSFFSSPVPDFGTKFDCTLMHTYTLYIIQHMYHTPSNFPQIQETFSSIEPI